MEPAQTIAMTAATASMILLMLTALRAFAGAAEDIQKQRQREAGRLHNRNARAKHLASTMRIYENWQKVKAAKTTKLLPA